MKKSKKLLLGAISGMALMAIATGSVATMAWFQTTASATATRAAQAETVNVETTSGVASNILFTVTVDNDTAALQLTDSNGKTGYWDSGLNEHVTGINPTSGQGEHKFTFTVTATKTAGAMTFTQALQAVYDAKTTGIFLGIITGNDLRAINAESGSFNETAGADLYIPLVEPGYGDGANQCGPNATQWVWTVYVTVSIAAHDKSEVIDAQHTAASYYSVTMNATVGDKSGTSGAFAEFQ